MKVTHVRKDMFGNISHVLCDNGEILDYLEAFDLAAMGQLEGIGDDSDDFGHPKLRSLSSDINLEVLPSF